jgi:hypothetical protein
MTALPNVAQDHSLILRGINTMRHEQRTVNEQQTIIREGVFRNYGARFWSAVCVLLAHILIQDT